jgi:hypothetical protein
LPRQILEVVLAAPLFLVTPLLRRWHLRWGARAEELAAAMPGDEQLPRAQFVATRAIDIAAPPEVVWAWLVQVGFGRAGFYSYDLLDGLGHPSADRILPEWQDLAVGDWMPMSPTPTETTAFRVAGFEPNAWLLWSKPDSTWAWRLQPTSTGGTRLVARLRCFYDFRHPALALLTVLLIEVGDFAMFRKMLLGIRERAERRR